jgi:type II secretory pathway component PulF
MGVIASVSMTQANRRLARSAVRVGWLRPQHRHSELVVAKIATSHRLHLLRSHAAQPLNQALASVQGQAQNPVVAEFARLVKNRI